MNLEELETLKTKDAQKIKKILQKFNEKHSKLFDFTEFNSTGQWAVIWKSVFKVLHDDDLREIYPECLTSIRILSREKLYLNSNIEVQEFDCLLRIANLSSKPTKIKSDVHVSVEALKCLCNMVFQSLKCQDMCSKNSAVEGILNSVKSPENFPYEIEYFQMKLLFLITALNVGSRLKVRDDLNGVTYLSEWLDIKIKEADRSEQQVDLICEILKVLFNVTINLDIEGSKDENEIQHRRLTSIIRHLIISCSSQPDEKHVDLISNAVNLLTNIPTICFSELLISEKSNVKTNTNDHKDSSVFEGYYILAVDVLLNYLKIRLDGVKGSPGQFELLAPILSVLVKCVRSNKTMRHYIRMVILPPLRNVRKRPEEGDEVRNHLCRFLTLPDNKVRELTAELLFVCCKENVGRMIKHTGYGNAAGLLANRGLLGGRTTQSTEYSSDSEDSDTEEYKELQHGINPVLGCYEPPRPNPMEGMSDEQKEYEAMKLVNLMDQLHRQGVVQPCRIGEDGRPEPVDHILQLQDEIQNQQADHKRKN